MKTFKNNFSVKGPFVLLEAFRKVVEELGWKYSEDFNKFVSRGSIDVLYFNGTIDYLDTTSRGIIHRGYFSLSSDPTAMDLTTSWNEAVKLASEMETPVQRIKVGDWVTYTDSRKRVKKVTKIDNTDTGGPSGALNVWSYNDCICDIDSSFVQLATPEEIESELIRQTGFSIGDIVKSKSGEIHNTDFDIKKFVLITGDNYNQSKYCSNSVLKYWETTKEPFIAVTDAQSIVPAVQMEKGSQLRIGRRAVEKVKLTNASFLKVGCQDFTKDALFLLRDICVSGVLEPGIINVYSSADHERYTITTEILDKAIKLLES